MDAEREIRDYLLGTLPAQRLQEVEQRILADDEFHQEIEIAEDDLLDDYTQGNLPAQERRLFEKHFLASPMRRQRLEFARALQERLNSPVRTAPAMRLIRSTQFYRYALVASLILAAFLGMVSYRASKTIQQERDNAAVLRKELEESNRQQAQLVPNSILQTDLAPRGSRGGPQPRLSIPKGARAVRFVLAVPLNLHGASRVDLLNDAGQLILSQQGNLIAQGKDQNLLTAIVESKYLKPGDYFLRVTPVQAPALPEYGFQVSSNLSQSTD
jgi:hypothetical protein